MSATNILNIVLAIGLSSGIVSIIVSIVRSEERRKCEKRKVRTEYRFIPRTLQESQEYPIHIDEIYDSMTRRQTPWINDITSVLQ